MSNRERIERLAAEKAAARREKEEEKKARAAQAARRGSTKARSTRKKRADAAPVRLKAVWAVCRLGGDVVETYPYGRKDEAESAANRLNAEAAGDYIVRQEKVPM
jgi:hypothetical protein